MRTIRVHVTLSEEDLENFRAEGEALGFKRVTWERRWSPQERDDAARMAINRAILEKADHLKKRRKFVEKNSKA